MKNEKTCTICDRPRLEKSYCTFHRTAYENLKRGFKKWKYAYGSITYEDYLLRILAIKETGKWVRDVALHQMKKTELAAKVVSN